MNVAVVGHFYNQDRLFVSALLSCIEHSQRGDVILVIPKETTDTELKALLKECIALESIVTNASSLSDAHVPALSNTDSIRASLENVLKSFHKAPVPVPEYVGTPWPPLKKRVPMKFHPGHKHQVGIHLIRPRRKLSH